VLKIRNYLLKMQESSQQMCQIASECGVADPDIELASTQIERNMVKATNGVLKHVGELVKRWAANEELRIEQQRLEVENQRLVALTTTLQANFRETDRLIRHFPDKPQGREHQGEGERSRVRAATSASKEVAVLEDKLGKQAEKLKRLEEENTTIKNIHQRTMKKLERIEQQSEAQAGSEGEGIQEERRRWLEKNEEMYEEMRRLRKELMLAEDNERKVKEELGRCLEIYTRWEAERDSSQAELNALKAGIADYLTRISELENALADRVAEAELLEERVAQGEAEKEKIVGVYQLKVQELTDQLLKKQDVIAELDSIINQEYAKTEELKRQHGELAKTSYGTAEKIEALAEEADALRNELKAKESDLEALEKQLLDAREELQKQVRLQQAVSQEHEREVQRLAEEKEEIAEVMQ
jgi:chromosome segregation ATPase